MTDKVTIPFNGKPQGKSGTEIVSGVYQEEYLTELTGTNAHVVYNRMRRNDPQIRKIIAAIVNPIKAAKWSIDPVSDDKKDIEVAALMEQILFKDISFRKKLNEILTSPIHGFAAFEVINVNRESKEFGPYTGLANLAFRDQSSIEEWKHDPNTGELLQIHQKQSGDIEVDVWLDVKNMLIFFNEQEGDDNGFPILRPLYGPWKRKALIETLKMIGIERSAIPTPTLKVPETISVNDEEYLAAISVLSNFTSAENSYITYPDGWELDLHQNNGFNPMNLEDSIKREDEKMAGAILATFLELGTGGNGGAYALGENLERVFSYVIESFATGIAEVINQKLIPSLVKLNYGDTVEILPELSVSGITNRVGKEFMEIITGYTAAGVIGSDEQLEDYVRKVHNLPKKAEGTAIENQSAEGGDNNDDDPNDTPPAKKKPIEDDKEELKDSTQLSEGSIELAEAKKPNSLITQESKVITDTKRTNLKFIADKLIADIMRKYKQLPEAQKLKSVENVNVGGTAKFKRQLKGVLTTTANKSLVQVKKDSGITKDVKLANNEEFFKLLDNHGSVKFQDNEFSALPPHIRKLIQLQSDRIVDTEVKSVEDRVVFSFMQNEQGTDSALKLEQGMTEAADTYIDSGARESGSITTASTVVNQTRMEYFFAPEVLEEVYAFRFENPDPKAEICKTLVGKVFAKNDADFAQLTPPLHFGCRSFLSVILGSAKTKPIIEPLPPISEKARKSINLSDKIDNLLRMALHEERNMEGC